MAVYYVTRYKTVAVTVEVEAQDPEEALRLSEGLEGDEQDLGYEGETLVEDDRGNVYCLEDY